MSKKIYRRWPVTFSPRSPRYFPPPDPARLRVITRGSKRHFSSAQYFFYSTAANSHRLLPLSLSISIYLFLTLLPLSDSLHPPRHRYLPLPEAWVRVVGRGRAYFVPFQAGCNFNLEFRENYLAVRAV